MNQYSTRIIGLLLVPCLLANPAFAVLTRTLPSGMPSARSRAIFHEQVLEMPATCNPKILLRHQSLIGALARAFGLKLKDPLTPKPVVVPQPIRGFALYVAAGVDMRGGFRSPTARPNTPLPPALTALDVTHRYAMATPRSRASFDFWDSAVRDAEIALEAAFQRAFVKLRGYPFNIDGVRKAFRPHEHAIAQRIRDLKFSTLMRAATDDDEATYMAYRRRAAADFGICERIYWRLVRAATAEGFQREIHVAVAENIWHIYPSFAGIAIDAAAGQFNRAWLERVVIAPLDLYGSLLQRHRSRLPPITDDATLHAEFEQLSAAISESPNPRPPIATVPSFREKSQAARPLRLTA